MGPRSCLTLPHSEQMGPNPNLQRVQRRSSSLLRHLFRPLPHDGREAAQIRYTVSKFLCVCCKKSHFNFSPTPPVTLHWHVMGRF
jgi:hypothetical protein